MKLVNGNKSINNQCRKVLYNPKDINYVFMALSFCLFLDFCLQTPAALLLVKIAVNSFIKIIIFIDYQIGVMYILISLKPIIAKATIKLLCKNDKNWFNSIQIFAIEFFKKNIN